MSALPLADPRCTVPQFKWKTKVETTRKPEGTYLSFRFHISSGKAAVIESQGRAKATQTKAKWKDMYVGVRGELIVAKVLQSLEIQARRSG